MDFAFHGTIPVHERHEFPDPASVAALPEAHAREWGALVLRRTDFGFDVVVADPSDTSIAERLSKAGYETKVAGQ